MKYKVLICCGIIFIIVVIAVLFSKEQKKLLDTSFSGEVWIQEQLLSGEREEKMSLSPSVSQEKETVGTPSYTTGVVGVAPFVVQAPMGKWKDSVFQNGCEEASVLMASRLGNEAPISNIKAEQEILVLSQLSEQLFGTSVDTSAEDTLKLFQAYTGREDGILLKWVTGETLLTALAQGEILIVPLNGRLLKNPHFTLPGPETHMVLVLGYDAVTDEYITHDPGTRFGALYRYPKKVFEGAIRDYPTGNHLPIASIEKRIIAIGR
ncbi:MAG: hypothetical protein KBC83_04015 [Candidatus Moranbacteria bacterium]|jgi:hypothetical protein|nr:hypothetical protein [Candidatus Moranbacteria bacterium]MBP9801800.1 hypothetical protein [Candidatus Moranbacteria bacterium]